MKISYAVMILVAISLSLNVAFGQPDTISIDTNKINYLDGDKITVSGSVDEVSFGTEVSLLVISPSGDTIFIDKLTVDSDKKFQTTLFSDASKLKDSGQYTVLAMYGADKEMTKTTFNVDKKMIVPVIDEPKKNILLNFDFVNPNKKAIQEHVDYKVTILRNGENIFGPTPLTHAPTGSVSIPTSLAVGKSYVVKIDVFGVLFQPIPVETSTFSIMTGTGTIQSQPTSNGSLKINLAIDKDPSPEPKQIPVWVKNTAKWWSDGRIDDKAFAQGIKYLIEEKIVNIPNLPHPASWQDKTVPEWVKNNASWWADDLIQEDDFIKGIKFLVEKGVIDVNQF